MVPGARSKFGAPMFKSELFRKQIYCRPIAESTYDIVGIFGTLIPGITIFLLCLPK